MKPRKIYLASSWKNDVWYDQALRALRDAGHEVYDFKSANANFRWEELDPNWRHWSPEAFLDALETYQSSAAFESDIKALDACDTCVLITPAGNSAHLELGYAAGQGKDCYTLINPGFQADLMLLVGHVVDSIDDLLFHLEDDVR